MSQLTNLRNLLAVGERILAERRMDIGFGLWECATYACLIGHYGHAEDVSLSDYAHSNWRCKHFGIDDTQDNLLFLQGFCNSIAGVASEPGPEAYAELERRLTFLRHLIAEREPKFTGLPSMVRALFEGEAVKS